MADNSDSLVEPDRKNENVDEGSGSDDDIETGECDLVHVEENIQSNMNDVLESDSNSSNDDLGLYVATNMLADEKEISVMDEREAIFRSKKPTSSKDSDDPDSDSDESTVSNTSKTLKHLGITINDCQKTWNSLKSLQLRKLGLRIPCLFERNVSSSVNMIQKFKLERQLEYHEGCVNTLNFNESGDLLASGSDDLKIVLWDWLSGKEKYHYDSGHTGNVFQAKFMPNTNDNIIVSCARDGQVRVGFLSSAGTSTQTKCLAQHRDGAHKLSIEPGSPNMFLSCGEDGRVMEFDLRMDCENSQTYFICRSEKNARVPLYSIYINPSKPEEFAVGGTDTKCRIYDRRQMKENIRETIPAVKEYLPHKFENLSHQFISITCLVYSNDGSELLVSYNDEDIYLFDANASSNSDFIHQYKGHRNNMTVKGVNFYGPQSEFVVSGSDCGHVFWWDKTTESIVQCLQGDVAGVVNCLEPHPHFPFMATSGLDHDIKIWTPTSKRRIKFDEIESVVLANDRERDLEREARHPSGDFLRFMVNQFAGRVRRTANATGDNNDDDSDSDEGERVQCYPS